jgi:hypothetical protein
MVMMYRSEMIMRRMCRRTMKSKELIMRRMWKMKKMRKRRRMRMRLIAQNLGQLVRERWYIHRLTM